ncbi:MAG: two-component system, NarL family, response regulator LiaR [Pseudonocardiales bacterium]|jgi:DNA-binding NarL/FixJ family response regulator|nr:two-component system, NarL family, response regulator LiaR [Pseudonocardiales bacterium]MDT7568100.1 two-component system, NarL family, response regulator LiaR [Pseudonocardiales bacterium]MDT7656994.1 two-component system, NarL family, response regulator LiaR [Pseudonocardiales bacterium]
MTATNRANAGDAVPVGYPILVIDDHELFSTTLRMALRAQGFDAHQLPITSIDHLRDRVAQFRPGLAVLDLDLGQDQDGRWMNGAELVEALCARGWQVLVVSGSVDTPGVAAAIAAGAVGSVPKSTSFDGLLDVVLAAAAGEPVMTEVEQQDWVTRHRGYLAQERELARRLGRLSAREREVLDLLAEGLRAAEIAEHFMVSITTVRTQIRNMHTKLEVQSQLGAVALVRQARQW